MTIIYLPIRVHMCYMKPRFRFDPNNGLQCFMRECSKAAMHAGRKVNLFIWKIEFIPVILLFISLKVKYRLGTVWWPYAVGVKQYRTWAVRHIFLYTPSHSASIEIQKRSGLVHVRENGTLRLLVNTCTVRDMASGTRNPYIVNSEKIRCTD